MRTIDVLEHFGNNQAAVARDLGITRKAVNKWGELVPPNQARRLHERTAGKLRYDPTVYIGRYPAHYFLPPAVEAA